MIKQLRLSSLVSTFLMLLFVTSLTNVYSQRSSEKKMVKIYDQAGLKVEVEFKIYNDPCSNSGKNHKYKYKISGDLPSYNKYLVWSLDIENCNGGAKRITRSIDIGPTQKVDIFIESMNYQFNSKSFDPNNIYGVVTSNKEVQEDERIIVKKNKIPDEIIIKNSNGSIVANGSEINYGEDIFLTFIGGELFSGAKWVWYTDKCGGKKLDEGNLLRVTAVENMAIYLGVEGGANPVNCISKEIYVNTESKLPTKIKSPDIICQGESLVLSIDDGFLGPNSIWEWFEVDCGGKKIGEGDEITVQPSENTRYYVKAGGVNSTENCLFSFVKVSKNEKSILPKKLDVPLDVCQGDSVILEVDTYLAEGSNWVWYFTQDGMYKTRVGVGSRKIVYPSKSGSYLLKSKDVCGFSEKFVESNKFIFHENKNSYQYLSVSPPSPIVGQKVNVFVDNFDLSSIGSKWEWKLNSKELKTSKPKIKFKLKSSTSISSIERKVCSTNKLNKYLVPESKQKNTRSRSFTRWYSKYSSNDIKTIHFGASIGIFGTYKNYNIDISGVIADFRKYIQIGGFEYQLVFHPIIRDKFSFGIHFKHQIGNSYMSFLDKSATESYSSLNLARLRLGTNLAFGSSKKFKILVAYDRTFEDFRFKYETLQNNFLNPNNISFIQNIEDEFKIGMRFKPYSNPKLKKATTIDILLNLFHQHNLHNIDGQQSSIRFVDALSIFNFNSNNFKYGAEFNLWMQSGVGLNFKYFLNGPSNSSQAYGKYYQLSLLWNFDFFR